MSKQITVNGKIFEPSASLAKRFGYSLDYVSRLAREGKVSATRVGRQWFVDAVSLKHFVDEVTLKKDQSREQLRLERKRELGSRQNTLVSTVVTPAAKSPAASTAAAEMVGSPIVATSKQTAKIATTAVGSFLVMVAGVLGGVALNPSAFLALTEHYTPRDWVITQATEHTMAGALGSWFGRESGTLQPDAASGLDTGVVVFDETITEAEVEHMRASFSDEVDVVFESDDAGVITPVFQDGRGDEYRFLMVPVRDAS